MAAFCRLALQRPRLKIETSAQRWREITVCCAAVMSMMSFSWWYTMSTSSAEGAGPSEGRMLRPLMVDGGGDIPGPNPAVGEVTYYAPLSPKSGFVVV
jgi:hypothetical protein